MRKISLLIATCFLAALVFGACGNQTPQSQSDSADAITPTARGGSLPGEISPTALAGTNAPLQGTITAALTNPSSTTVAPATTSNPLNTPGASTTSNPLVDGSPQPTFPSRELTPQPGGPNSSLQTPGNTPTALSIGTPVGNLTDPMTESLRGLTGKDFEISFLQLMINHHQMALDMSQLAPTRSQRAEIVKLAQEITNAQTGEIATMKGYLQSWHNAQPLAADAAVPGMSDSMMHMNHLKSLKGDDFDRTFLREMLAHHQQALNMANLIPERTQRSELVQLGKNIIQSQTREIEQIRTWLTNFK